MKMTKKKVFVVALVVCLVAVMSMGSLAWFSAQDSVSNKFYVADSDVENPDDIFSVKVYEEKDGQEYEDGIEYDDILPGDELEKKAIVENTGHYSQYIRVTITISDKDVWQSIIGENNFASYDVRQHFVGFDSSKWDLEHSTVTYPDNTIQYVLYYKNVLNADETITVFEAVKIPEEITQQNAYYLNGGFTIDVKAEAVQTENVGSSAYEAFQTVMG